jgi:hypothetical protein
MTYQRFDWDFQGKHHTLELDDEQVRISKDGVVQLMRYDHIAQVYFDDASVFPAATTTLHLRDSDGGKLEITVTILAFSNNMDAEDALNAISHVLQALREKASASLYFKGAAPSVQTYSIFLGVFVFALGFGGLQVLKESPAEPTLTFGVLLLITLVAVVTFIFKLRPQRSTPERLINLVGRPN